MEVQRCVEFVVVVFFPIENALIFLSSYLRKKDPLMETSFPKTGHK